MVREQFVEMMKYLREGDTLITTAIDRLGRNSIDVQQTIAELKSRGINIIITDLGIDLNSKAGNMFVGIMSAVAEMERETMLERQKAGIARAQAEGKYKGRPKSLNPEDVRKARKTMSIADTAEYFGVSVATVKRLQKADLPKLAKKPASEEKAA